MIKTNHAMEKTLKLWHLILCIIIAGVGNLLAVGAWVGKQSAVIEELRKEQARQAAAISHVSSELARVEKDSVQLIDLKLRISRVEDKLDRVEPKLGELIGELRNRAIR